MLEQIKIKLEKYKQLNDVHQYALLLDVATDFVTDYDGILVENVELELGIDIIMELGIVKYLGSMREYEHNYALHKQLRHLQIKVFKICIPPSHAKLRGLTEFLLGMKENAVG